MRTSISKIVLALAIGVLPPLFASLAAAPAADIVELRVDGRSNATPWIASDGDFVAVVWGATADAKTDVYSATSRDGGRTFSVPVRVNGHVGEARLGGELPPRVALVAGAGLDPEVVVLWTAREAATTVKIARSSDGGRSFAPATTLSSAGAAGDRGWPALTVDRTGTAHAIWLDHRGMAANRAGATAHAEHMNANAHDGAAMAQLSGLFYAATAARPAAERQLTPGVCYCCKTALAVAPDGVIYAAWRHVYPGNLRDIAMSVSRDSGRSFSAPQRVSEDKWELNGCPDDGPAMAIDAAGTIHLVWPTVLSNPEPQGALFYTTTRDGRSFTPRVRVPTLGSPKPSHPQVVVDARGRVTVAWDELRDGSRVAVARSLTSREGQPPTFSQPHVVDANASSMYPVLSATSNGLVAAWTSGAPGASIIRVSRLAHSVH